MTRHRRFIAGAVCPSCKEMDKLFIYESDDKKIRECVRCGFQEEIDQQGSIKELTTGADQQQQHADDEPIDVVQLIDRPANAPIKGESGEK